MIAVPRFRMEPDRILIFKMSELFVLILGFGIGVVFRMVLIGLVIGIVLFIASRRLSKMGLMHKVMDYVYWYSPAWLLRICRFEFKGLPPSSCRVMTGGGK